MWPALVTHLLSRRTDVVALYAFGSRARGDGTPESDYDVAVLARAPIDPIERFELQEELAGIAHCDVDLVDLRRASTVMRVQVLKDGEVLFERDRCEREMFEATAFSAYARLNEERKGIVADALNTGRVHG